MKPKYHPRPNLLPALAFAIFFWVVVAVVVSFLTNCAPQHAFLPDKYSGTPNPLDEPGETRATQAELHEQNIRIIRQGGSN